ncbi:MAG: carboxypeptidase regulatory-like domain-containing protein [Gemmataceae bacterium]|nr:carboxypeptidase regulatory-like domain-containing protein [Gemmataceae bacterium]
MSAFTPAEQLVGYVSDEKFVALDGVRVEFVGKEGSFETESRATGAVYAPLLGGQYRVTLRKDGFGAKSVDFAMPPGQPPYHFRLMSNTLYGYAWPKWSRTGEKAEFRVHAMEPYQLELFRYGWKKEKVRSLGWWDEHGPLANQQVTPDGDYSQTGVEWNQRGYNNNAVHRQFVEAPGVSGLYYFHATGASGASFTFPWIVAPSEPQGPVAVLASNINWNAYNSFGGRSNYINADALPSRPTVNSRLDLKRYTQPGKSFYDSATYAPLSFDRPEPINHIDAGEKIMNPIEGRAACHIAAAEWRLLGWMEKENLPYDFYAETQLHSGALDLSRYRVLVLSTHPEYWSRQMYERVKRWVFHEGGKLIYLGGNGLNCEVVFHGEYTMEVKNGNCAEIASANLESRFHLQVESEANLLGVVFTEAGAMTGAPYQVVDARHWAFKGTELKEGAIFGKGSLHRRCPGGASAHETDKTSPSSPVDVRVIARGMNQDNGGAEIIHYKTQSGGEVFSVGSIAWPSSVLVDKAVSRITKNVFKQFLK